MLDKMQEDALRRVREMQSANSSRRPQQNPQSAAENIKKEESDKKELAPSGFVPNDPLAGLFKDKEKLLILLLVMILSQESSNTELVLALLYIII